jgi:site-specific DNA-adenine methylase
MIIKARGNPGLTLEVEYQMAHKTIFSYYGGKGAISNKYPDPHYKTIIEPFAGGAAYSLRWYKHDVIIIEINKRTYDVWKFIQSKNAIKWVNYIPQKIIPGTKISSIIEDDWPPGLVWFLRSAANVGTFGTNKIIETVTSIGAEKWKHNTVDKLIYWHSKIRHWEIIFGGYQEAPDLKCTWFIDPPYHNAAGEIYMHGSGSINYDDLKKWVLNRMGQVIACENEGCSWLDVNPISKPCGVNGKHVSKYRKSECAYIRYRQKKTNNG